MLDAAPDQSARKHWIEVLAKAPADDLIKSFEGLGLSPEYAWLRAPEFGSVMVRGRMGGTGNPFNLGEMTVTRCSLRLQEGAVGHAYVAGRDADKARVAALCDALMQGDDADQVRVQVIAPMEARIAKARADHAAKAAATKVDFFTLVRGED